MNTQVLLLAQSLKRVRTIVLAMGLLLGGFQFILIAVARSIQASMTVRVRAGASEENAAL